MLVILENGRLCNVLKKDCKSNLNLSHNFFDRMIVTENLRLRHKDYFRSRNVNSKNCILKKVRVILRHVLTLFPGIRQELLQPDNFYSVSLYLIRSNIF